MSSSPWPRLSQFLSMSAALGIVLCAGCGPFGYLKKVAKDATRSVADAEAVGAQEYSPYEYWGAVAYLEQAKVMMGYSEYERSFDYGERATQLASEAKIKAERVVEGRSVVHAEGVAAPAETPTEIVPVPASAVPDPADTPESAPANTSASAPGTRSVAASTAVPAAPSPADSKQPVASTVAVPGETGSTP